MSLPSDVCTRFSGFGLDCSVVNDEVHVKSSKITKIRFDPNWVEAYKKYKRARSLSFDYSARTLIHNNSVEIQLTRLAPVVTLAPEQYTLSDRQGNTVKVGLASEIFALAYFDTPEYDTFFEARIKRRLVDTPVGFRRFQQLTWMPSTALYTARGRKTPTDLRERALASMRSTLFKIAVEQHDCLAIWKQQNRRLRSTHLHAGPEDQSIPASKYDENVVSYYKVAKASPFPSQSFLAYYHVMEYYFLRVSETILHDRLTAILNDPRFRSDRDSLDKVISMVRGRDARSDETEMLRNVLDRFVPETDLIDFIEKFETACGEKIYSKKRTVFGEQVQVALVKDHALANAAKALKHVRNAIVHSSDKYKREECHIPLSDSENVIEEFIPLARFFAEKVIYGTAV